MQSVEQDHKSREMKVRAYTHEFPVRYEMYHIDEDDLRGEVDEYLITFTAYGEDGARAILSGNVFEVHSEKEAQRQIARRVTAFVAERI